MDRILVSRCLSLKQWSPCARGFPPKVSIDSFKSAQRESNPHIRPRRAADSRTIMGTRIEHLIIKEQEHRVGVEPTPPRCERGVLGSGPPVLRAIDVHEDWLRGLRTPWNVPSQLIDCGVSKTARSSWDDRAVARDSRDGDRSSEEQGPCAQPGRTHRFRLTRAS